MKRLLIPILVLISIVLVACGSTAQSKPIDITLEVSSMHYQPDTIEVIAGQPVRLTFHNNDTLEHDFSIMEIPMATMGATAMPMAGHDSNMTTDPQLHMSALIGATNTIEFTPTKPGTYEFFCTVAGHKEGGMIGTLIVKAP